MRLIRLTGGKFAQVDDDDYESVSRFPWYAKRHSPGKFQAARSTYFPKTGKRETILMHRALLRVGAGLLVDHVDGDPLNNKRENLRACTRSQNKQNAVRHRNCQSKFKGVHLLRKTGKWMARITTSGRRMSLGYFADEAEAEIG